MTLTLKHVSEVLGGGGDTLEFGAVNPVVRVADRVESGVGGGVGDILRNLLWKRGVMWRRPAGTVRSELRKVTGKGWRNVPWRNRRKGP